MASRKRIIVAAAFGVLIASWLIYTALYCSGPETYLMRHLPGHKSQSCCVDIVADWFRAQRSFTPAEVEAAGMSLVSFCGGKNCPKAPFGTKNAEWKRFIAQYKAGDTLRYFKSSSAGSYTDGYFIERGGKRIADFSLTMMVSGF